MPAGMPAADLSAAVALGGDCLAGIAVLREQPQLAGPVASDPVVSRLVSLLVGDQARALKAIGLVTVDLDATVVIAHFCAWYTFPVRVPFLPAGQSMFPGASRVSRRGH